MTLSISIDWEECCIRVTKNGETVYSKDKPTIWVMSAIENMISRLHGASAKDAGMVLTTIYG